MLIWVIVVGCLVLVGLAVAVGLSERRAQDAAWRRIADGRRLLAERSRRLDEQAAALVEQERGIWAREARLVAATQAGECPVCALRRRRGEQPAG